MSVKNKFVSIFTREGMQRALADDYSEEILIAVQALDQEYGRKGKGLRDRCQREKKAVTSYLLCMSMK